MERYRSALYGAWHSAYWQVFPAKRSNQFPDLDKLLKRLIKDSTPTPRRSWEDDFKAFETYISAQEARGRRG